MGDRTGIEWTDATWNPVTGCTKVSSGCDHCYAEKIAHRFAGTMAYPNGFDVTLRSDRLEQPLRWKRPRRVFVNSMSDLFHDAVPDIYLEQVFDVMERARQHTFQLLTKRHARMRSFVNAREARKREYAAKFDDCPTEAMRNSPAAKAARERAANPPPNIWLGVSTESQPWADIRIPALLDTPAAVRFISAEPLLGPIDLTRITPARVGGPLRTNALAPSLDRDTSSVLVPGLDWVIVGGESGPGARPMHPEWVYRLQEQCVQSNVAFLFKQWGEWSPLAPLDDQGRFDFRGGHVLANDGTLYAPGDLAWPDGPRRGEALRADHGRARLTSVYRVGKKAAGRDLDGRTWDEYPGEARP